MVLMPDSWKSEVRIGKCVFCKYKYSLVKFWNTYLEIPTIEYVLSTSVIGVIILSKIHCRKPNCPKYTQVTSDANLIKWAEQVHFSSGKLGTCLAPCKL